MQKVHFKASLVISVCSLTAGEETLGFCELLFCKLLGAQLCFAMHCGFPRKEVASMISTPASHSIFDDCKAHPINERGLFGTGMVLGK